MRQEAFTVGELLEGDCEWEEHEHLMREVIRGPQRSSELIRAHQWPTEVIRGHESSSVVIRD